MNDERDSLSKRVQRDPQPVTLSDTPSGPLLPSVWTHGSPPSDSGHEPREARQLVICRACSYFLDIHVQNRRGSHGCAHCGGQMEVYEPRPGRFGGLHGAVPGGSPNA